MNTFFFGIYPYIALSVFVVGSVIRYDREPYTWKSSSSQLLRRKQLMVGSVLFHIGVLTIFFGHLFGLLTPLAVIDALGISHEAKQILAMSVGGVAGVLALIGGGMLAHRRLNDPRVKATSSFADTSIILILLLQLVLGVSTIAVSAQHLDGEEMTKLMIWAQHILTFRSAADHIADVNLLFKLHIVLGLTIFLIFPFTRLVHILSAPVRYLWRPGYQIVRTRKRVAPQAGE